MVLGVDELSSWVCAAVGVDATKVSEAFWELEEMGYLVGIWAADDVGEYLEADLKGEG
jgi:hypothetical protein